MRIIEQYRAAFRGLSREVWLLSCVALINRSGAMVVPFLTLYLTQSKGYSASTAGSMLALYGGGGLIGVSLGGYIADRVEHRLTMAASLFGSGLMLLVLSQLESLAALACGIFALGLVSESIRPANMAAIADYATPSERPRAYGLNRLALNLGWSIGPTIGGVLIAFGYGWLFILDGATCIAAGIFLLAALPKSPKSTPTHKAKGESTRGPGRDVPYLLLLVCLFLQALVFFQLHSTFPLYLTIERGLDVHWVGFLIAINTILIVLFEMIVVHRAERYRPLTVIAIAALFVAFGFGLLPFAATLPAIALTIVLWTVGEMLFAPVLTTWIANRSTDSNRGRYMAGMGVCFSIAGMTAPLIGTWTYEHHGGNVLWGAALAVGVIACLGTLALQRALGRR